MNELGVTFTIWSLVVMAILEMIEGSLLYISPYPYLSNIGFACAGFIVGLIFTIFVERSLR